MNKGLFSKFLPHLIAVIIFLIVSIIYCRPALEGKVLAQHDITQWQGAMHQSDVFKEQHGHAPLWTQSMFGGMPTFQIGFETHNVIPGVVQKILTLGLPEPIQFFFLACICFYFLCVVLRVNPYIGILGALGFAYATYNPVIIVAGHVTKMWAIAYMPAVLASLILIYEKKYWVGTALTALFTATMIAMNHPQMAYYFFIVAAIMTIFYVVRWIKQKEWKHFGIAFVCTVVAGVTGLLVNAESIYSTYEYQKQTIRGGASALTDSTNKDAKSQTGLDKDYAFNYSMYVSEPFVMFTSRIFGGSDGYPSVVGGKGWREMSEDGSKAIEALQSVPDQRLGNQLAQATSLYWGGIGGTSGPPYVGAIICFLAILSFFLPQNKHRWWALTAIVLAIMMSWGSYFKEFNYFIYDVLPFYNKFRAPSMILVIPQLLLPMMAVIAMDIYSKNPDLKTMAPYFKKGLIATGAVFLVLFLMYFSFDYLSQSDSDALKYFRGANQPQLYQVVKQFFDGLAADRRGMFMGDIFRSLGFIAVAIVALYLMMKKSLKPLAAIVVITFFAFIDVILIDSRYLNSTNYEDKEENQNSFQLTKVDEEILADKSYYRVFNISGDRFAEAYTSYHYNSLGGYHAVKLRLYQDMIEHQLSNISNPRVLDMLNVKYIIQKEGGVTKQYQKNPTALGPAWLVGKIQYVKDADQEMAELSHLNPKDTALVQESFKSSIPFEPVADSSATIQLTKNENDLMTYSFNAASNQFAVFSEVYYEPGWNATIDGKPAPIVKTDYILRGIAIPAGKHTIEMKFEPPAYMTGRKLTTTFNIVLVVLLLAAIFLEWRDRRRQPTKPVA